MKLRSVVKAAVLAVIALGVGIGLALSRLDAETYRRALTDAAGAALGRTMTIAGPMSIGLDWPLSLTARDVALANAPWAGEAPFLTAERLRAEIAILPLIVGTVEVTGLVLEQPRLLLQTNGDGKGNWVLPVSEEAGDGHLEVREPAPDGILTFDLGSLRLNNARVLWRPASGAEMEVAMASFQAEADTTADALSYRLLGRWGDQPLEATGTVGSVARFLANGAGWPLTAQGRLGSLAFAMDSRLTRPLAFEGLSGSLTATTESLASLAGAPFGAVPFELRARILQDGRRIVFHDMDLRLDTMTLKGQLALDQDGGRLRVGGHLNGPLLDLRSAVALRRDRAPVGGAGQGTGTDADAPIIPAYGLHLDGLGLWPALAIRIDAERLVLPGDLAFDRLRTDLLLDQGKLALSPIQADLAGGGLNGILIADGTGAAPSYGLALVGDGLMLGRLLDQVGLEDMVDGGPLRLDVALAGSGGDTRALAKTLRGGLMVDVGDGVLHHGKLGRAGEEAAWLDALIRGVDPLADEVDQSRLRCVVANLRAKDGVVLWDRGLALETERLAIATTGSVSLGGGRVDVGILPGAREDLMDLPSRLTRLHGRLADPRVTVNAVTALGPAEPERTATENAPGTPGATLALDAIAASLLDAEAPDPAPCRTAQGRKPPPLRAGETAEEAAERTLSSRPTQTLALQVEAEAASLRGGLAGLIDR